MNKPSETISNDINQLADDARALMSATADIAGEKVGEARKRLASALDTCGKAYGSVREKVVEGASKADDAVHANPYQAIAIGVGVGAVLGFLVATRCACKRS